MTGKILIVGRYGTVGNAVSELAAGSGYEITGTTSSTQRMSQNCWYVNFDDLDALSDFSIPETVDHLVIACGKEPQKNLQESSVEHIESMFRVHVLGPMLLIKQISDSIKIGGSITFISSPAAYKGSYDPSYSAVKGAVNSLVRTLAKDFGSELRVNALSPSLIQDSAVYDRMTDDFRDKHRDMTLNKRFLTAKECAVAILFLIESQHMTGQILNLNGGMVYGS